MRRPGVASWALFGHEAMSDLSPLCASKRVRALGTRPESALTSEAGPSTQARVKAAYEFTAQPRLGNGRGALERWPRKQALTIGRGAGTEQRGEVGFSHVIERIADRNVCERHPPRHQEVTTLQPLLE